MATITLQDYYDKLEELLIKNANDEVIRHCRHILQFFPKNAKTFRYLGRALLESGEIEEAGEVFRRLLGVYPDDYIAHVALSEVYQKTNKPDDALWHLERAFEQEPNNQSLIDMLRELYQRYRKVEQAKMQLTAAAVARQYVRNELYGQAIDVLQQAIDRAPERMDLRVLLAETLWDGNQRVEAAEHSLDVLNTLPDCFAANRIMTILWLDEQRPSDAQRFLSHIEGVEPYIALELAKGTSSPEDLTLEELDYSRLAQQELAMASPDWLQDLGDLGDQMMEDEPSFHELPADPTQPVPDDDWLKTLAEASAEKTVNLSKEDLLAAKKAAAERAQASGIETTDDLFAEMEETSKKPTSSLEGLFDDIPASTSGTAGFTDFLDTLATAPTDRPTAPVAADDDDDALAWLQGGDDLDEDSLPATDDRDPLSWMREAGVEVDESASSSRLDPYGTDEKMEFRAPDTSNPLAWLQGEDEQPAADADDPLAWMRDAGIETVEENPTATPVVKPSAMSAAKPQRQNVGDDAFLDEMLDMEKLSATGSWEVPAVSADQLSADDEMPDWISGADMSDEQAAEAVAEDDDALSWMNTDTDQAPSADLFQEAVADEDDALSWMNAAEDEQPADDDFFAAPVAEADVPDWLSGSDLVDEKASRVEAVAEDDDDALSWMNAAEDEQVADDDLFAAPVAEADVPDWLSGSNVLDDAPEEAVADEDDALSWMNAAEDEQPADDDFFAAPVAEADVPDWLSGANVLDDAPAEEAVAEEDDALSWMNAAEDEQPADDDLFAAPVAEADIPDWLSGANVLDDAPAEEAVAEEDDALSWMNAAEDEQVADDDLFAAPVAEADVPDWLSGANVLDDAPVEEAVAEEDDALAWMNAAEDEQPTGLYDEPVAEDTFAALGAEAEVPDWMAKDDALAEEAVAEEDDALAWMNAADDEQPATADTFSELGAEAEVPDWMSSENVLETAAEDDQAADDLYEEAVAEETPDWLSSTGFDDDEQPAEDIAAAVADPLAWMSAAAAEQASVEDDLYEEAVAEETPDWLSGTGFDEVTKPVTQDEEMSAWMNDDVQPEAVAAYITPSDEELPAEDSTLEEWQTTMSDDEQQPSFEVQAADGEALPLAETHDEDYILGPVPAETLAEIQAQVVEEPVIDDTAPLPLDDIDELSFAPADDLPDLLAEPLTIPPQETLSEAELAAEADSAAVAENVPDWLSVSDFADDESAEEVTAVEETPDWIASADINEDIVAEETPDWLSGTGFVEDAPVEEAVAEDAPDWLSGTGFVEDAPVEEAVAEDAPDWLSDMSFDDDEQAVEEEIVAEETPDWLSSTGFAEEEAAEEASVVEDAPDWLAEMSFDDDEQAVEEEIIAEETPDWLSSTGFAEDTPVEEAVAEDAPDWLSDMSFDDDQDEQPAAVASTDDDEQALDWMVEPGADAGAQDEVDWMSELEEAAPTNEVAAQGDDFAWMEDDEQSEYEKPAISTGNTDWLTSVGISKREPAEQTDDFGETYDWADDADELETEAVAEDSPDWLSDMQTQQGSIDAPAEPVQAGASEYDWEDDLNEKPVPASMEDDFIPASEEMIAVPANNAPDWLNAMVPGLDVDPTAEEEESYERDFVTDAGGHRVRSALDPEVQRDFDWVSDIVEEETSSQPAVAPSMMPELPSTPEPKAPKQPRFSFSRLPAWLRRKPAAAAPAPAPAPVSVTEEPEWLREAEDTGDNIETTDDIDLPDWLK